MQRLAQVATMVDMFTQHSGGLLGEDQFKGVFATYRVWLREPGFRKQWLERRALLGQPKFTAFVASLLDDIPTPSAPKSQ